MKKYVFLTEHLSGLTGSERYVNNKCNFLRQIGWEVIVLWNYNIAPVQLEHIKCFDNKKYIHHELKFYPSWFSKIERDKVIDRLASVVGSADQIVLESSKLEIGAWGELLAKKLQCKHFVFVVTEEIKIQKKETFDFCYAKMKRNEFFTINEPAVKLLFSGFATIHHPENYYWSAIQGVEAIEYEFPAFDNLPRASYTITSFGRRKGYFPYMLNELKSFIMHHPEKTFNVFFLGDISNETEITDELRLENVNLSIYSHSVEIIPKQIFTKSDVVIATAGCVGLSASNGGRTISMDVNRNMPLGLYNYTTLDTNTFSGKYENNKTLSEWLLALLIEKEEFKPIVVSTSIHGFDYQLRNVNDCDYKYIDSTSVKEIITQHDGLYSLMVKIGLFRLVEYFYYKRRGVKVIRR